MLISFGPTTTPAATQKSFAVNREGKVLGVFKVEGAEANDWEAIATDRQGNLYIGDFGNNRNTRRDLIIYQVREPSFEPGKSPS